MSDLDFLRHEIDRLDAVCLALAAVLAPAFLAASLAGLLS